MRGMDEYMNGLFAGGQQSPPPQRPRVLRPDAMSPTSPMPMPRIPRNPLQQAPRPSPTTPPMGSTTKPILPGQVKTAATPTAPAAPTYSAQNPPPGFSSSQWTQLLDLSKNNKALQDLIKQFTTSLSAPKPDETWRRELPKDTTQLLRQLSFNAGEIGMPGGYVGAIQLPSYGSSAQPINNPNMATYGRAPGVGEATFYQQSMKGGMAPIAAMSPLGVPEGWNPGGASSGDIKSQLEGYLNNMQNTRTSQASDLMAIFAGLHGVNLRNPNVTVGSYG